MYMYTCVYVCYYTYRSIFTTTPTSALTQACPTMNYQGENCNHYVYILHFRTLVTTTVFVENCREYQRSSISSAWNHTKHR